MSDAAPSPGPESVGIVTPAWPVGLLPNGIVSYAAKMQAAIRGRGVRCFLLARKMGPGAPGQDVRAIETPGNERSVIRRKLSKAVWRVSGPERHDRQMAIAVARAVTGLAESEGLQLVQMEESMGWGRLVARRVPIPLVVRLHGPWFLNGRANGVPEDAEYHRRVRAERGAIEAAAGITAPSRDVIDRVRAFYGLELPGAEAIPNPVVPLPEESLWSLPEEKRILFVGRFDRHKGGDLVIDAFRIVHREVPEARLVFVGPDRGFVDDAGRRWSFAEFAADRLQGSAREALEFRGLVPNAELPSIRARSRLTIVASRYENFANTLLEAIAGGCPVVSSDGGGLPEIIQHEENGLLFRAGSAADLARQVIRLLREPELCERLGASALVTCRERYDPGMLADRTIDFYESRLPRESSLRRSGEA